MDNPIKFFAGVLFGAVLFILSLMSFTTVGTGHVGVETAYGEVQPQLLMPGFHTINPLHGVTEVDTRTMAMEYTSIAYTSDLQPATLKTTLNFNLDPASVVSIFMTVGPDWQQKLVPQVVYSSVKDVVGKWKAEDLVYNRDKAVAAITDRVRAELLERHVLLTSLSLTNIDYSDAFENAIEAKVVATQNALAEVNRTKQVEEKARQTVASAQAEAESMRIRANALEANPKLVEWERVQAQRDVGLALAKQGLPNNLTVFGSDSIPAMMLGLSGSK